MANPPVKLGWLTPRGGELIAYLGHYQRQRLVADGLLAKRAARSLVRSRLLLMSTSVPVKQAKPSPPGWRPDCAITVHTCADTSSPDPLFNPLKLAFANWIMRT